METGLICPFACPRLSMGPLSLWGCRNGWCHPKTPPSPCMLGWWLHLKFLTSKIEYLLSAKASITSILPTPSTRNASFQMAHGQKYNSDLSSLASVAVLYWSCLPREIVSFLGDTGTNILERFQTLLRSLWSKQTSGKRKVSANAHTEEKASSPSKLTLREF